MNRIALSPGGIDRPSRVVQGGIDCLLKDGYWLRAHYFCRINQERRYRSDTPATGIGVFTLHHTEVFAAVQTLAELVGVETHDRGELFLVVRRAPPAVLAPLVRIEIIVVLPESILVAGAVRCGVEQGLRLPRG